MYDVKKLFLFDGLDDTAIKTLTAHLGEIVEFKKGDIIYDITEFRSSIGVFISGKGAAYEGNTVKATFFEGGVFGAAAVFGAKDTYASRIVAGSACRILFIGEAELRSIMEKHPVCGINYIRFLSEKVRYLNGKIAQYTGNTGASRLYRLLLDKADENGRVENTNISSVAKQSGMGRTSVYRALAELEKSGMIEKENKIIMIRR